MASHDLSENQLRSLLMDQQKLLQQLKRAEEKYRAFVAHSSEGIWCFELPNPINLQTSPADQVQKFFDEAYLSECNDIVAKMYGYEKAAELHGKPLREFLVPTEEQNIQYLLAFIAAGYKLIDAESIEVDRDGKEVYFSNSLVGVVEDGFLLRAWGSQRDISLRKKVELEQRVAREAAEAAKLANSRFLANISHEIRSPLGVILGFSELVKNSFFSEEERNEVLDRIHRNAHQLLKLVDELLDLSRTEAEKLVLDKVDIDLMDFFADIKANLQMKAKRKGILLNFQDHGLALTRRIRTDPAHLREILVNVIGNAIQFTEDGLVEVVCKASQNTQSVGAHNPVFLEFWVHDTGAGIKPEDKARLFLPFSQMDNAVHSKTGGVGMGLSNARKLARALGGDVDLVSTTPDRGSIFKITVQAESLLVTTSREAEPLPVDLLKPSVADNSLAGLSVLVVEDSEDNCELIQHMLESAGAKSVQIAHDGVEAVEMALSSQPDLILMDLQIPKLNGYQATQKLRLRGFTRPILALTAHALKEERERCLNVGLDDHLTKPIAKENLVSKILEWWGEHPTNL